MAIDIEAEIRDLKRREIEGSFGFLTQQIKGAHKDLLAFQASAEQRFDKLDGRLGGVEGRLDRVEGRLDMVDSGLRGLRKDMPGIVGDAVRAVLPAYDERSRKKP